jgi:hypothetical protein
MTCEYQTFVANVMVINLTWETMAMDVINQLACAIAKLNAIVEIRKYRRFHDKHQFNLMEMEVQLNIIWIISLGNVLIF